jgi:hypothetical protein
MSAGPTGGQRLRPAQQRGPAGTSPPPVAATRTGPAAVPSYEPAGADEPYTRRPGDRAGRGEGEHRP